MGYRHHQGFEHARKVREFATVKAALANKTEGAILLTGDEIKNPVWVPRRALEPASQALVNRTDRGSEIEIRVELQMAIEKGLV